MGISFEKPPSGERPDSHRGDVWQGNGEKEAPSETLRRKPHHFSPLKEAQILNFPLLFGFSLALFPQQKTPEAHILFEHTECSFYQNGAVHA